MRETDVAEPMQAGRWAAYSVCLLAGFVTLLDVSVINVAVPSMQAGLHLSAGQVLWAAFGYTLTFGVVLVPAGALGDQLGRRRTLLAGLAFFAFGSLACGLAASGSWLVAARLVQGLAAGVVTPQVVGLMQQLFARGPELGKAGGAYSGMIAATTAIGPLVGGLLIQAAGPASGWRWVFLVNVPIAALSLPLGLRWLPRDRQQVRGVRLDLLGIVLLGSGVAALILPLIEAEQRRPSVPWYLLGVSALLLACFIAWEQHCTRSGRARLVNLAMLRQRDYAISAFVGLGYFVGFVGIPFVVSLYFQQGLGYSALAAGAVGTPTAIGAAISAPLAGRVVHRVGRRLVVIGLAAVALGSAGLVALIGHRAGGLVWLLVAGPLLLAGVGSGLVIGPNLTLALQTVPLTEGSAAGAVLQTGQRIGSTIGVAVIGALYFGSLTAHRGDRLRAATDGLLGSTVAITITLLITVIALLATRDRRPSRQPGTPATDGGRPG
ncbi:MFS transporter [Streptomyces sp. NPDC004542]|uniref:MFS transporter n=1 Tax=Streptomyces sp. NPDC004542 TaxID=3154281 RepID=UPI0033BBD1FC